MFIRSDRITPGANREITPPICLGATLRQTSDAARSVELRERVNMPDRCVATATPNPKSAFPRIYPVNPEPAVASAQNPKSTFPRIYPTNLGPTAARDKPQNPRFREPTLASRNRQRHAS